MSDETSEQAGEQAGGSKRPRRLGLWIRIAIYVPLLGFFGWQAVAKFQREGEAADDRFRAAVEQWVEHPPKTIMMPNGEAMPVLELSEDEAVEMGLIDKPGEDPPPASPDE